jgi:hypothetical protein
MRWEKLAGPILHKVGQAGDIVEMKFVERSDKGDLDLSRIEMWRCKRGRYSYVITADPLGEGYVASARPTEVRMGVIGDEQASVTDWLTDRAVGARTFTEAERLCEAHARGKRH